MDMFKINLISKNYNNKNINNQISFHVRKKYGTARYGMILTFFNVRIFAKLWNFHLPKL